MVIRPGGQVYVGERHVGRVSEVHSGTSSRFFAYCKVHQCYKGVAFSKNPYRNGVAKWLAAGVRPDVKTADQHKKLWEAFAFNP